MPKTGPNHSTIATATLPPFALDDRRACKDTNPDLFFPARGDTARHAKEICRSCVFVEPCLAYALPLSDLHGVWGATTTEDRINMRVRAEGKTRGRR